MNWPSDRSENAVLIAVLILSLAPILLALLDVIIERGAVVEYAGVKVDFSGSRPLGTAGVPVAANIGVRGEPVTDSGTAQILAALKSATATNVVIIDLEAGDAWWETRLLVLLAGAVRLGKPDKIVFVGTDEGKQQSFQGWSSARDLLPLLTTAHPQYLRSLQTARAIARQWELVEIPAPGSGPATPAWPLGTQAMSYQWMAFDATTGLRNELLEEQVLQNELGQKVEKTEGSRRITLVRLEDLFRPILIKVCIDRGWEQNRQTDALLEGEAPFLAITRGQRLRDAGIEIDPAQRGAETACQEPPGEIGRAAHYPLVFTEEIETGSALTDRLPPARKARARRPRGDCGLACGRTDRHGRPKSRSREHVTFRRRC